MDHMSYLTVYNAHNGESVRIPKPVRFHTLVSLKTYLLEHFTNYIIGSQDNIILLTSFGIKLNFQMINEMNDLYVLDKRLFNSVEDYLLVDRYLQQSEDGAYAMLKPQPFSPEYPGDNIKKLSSNLKVYDGWAKALIRTCHQMDEQIEKFIKHINTIFKSLNIIFQFAANFISGTEKSFNSYLNYIKLLSMKSLHKAWESHYNALKKFPKIRLKHQPTKMISLADHLVYQELVASANYVGKNLPHIVDKFNSFSHTVNEINDEKLNIDETIELLRKESITKFRTYEDAKAVKMNEINELSKSINLDLQTLQHSSTLNLHAINEKQMEVCPALFESANVMYGFSEALFEFKQKLVKDSLKIFQKVASLQMKMVEVKSDLKQLMNPKENEGETAKDVLVDYDTVTKIKEAEDFLSMTVDLPLLYGFILIEKRRQFEWHDFYSKGIVNNVSEQLTVMIDHEQIFQKLWLKKFGGFIKFLSPRGNMRIQLPTIDITLVNGNVSNRDDSVFNLLNNVDITRDDITRYIHAVKDHPFSNNTKFANLLEKNFKDLVSSTENMKRVTKVVSSLSSFTSPSNLEDHSKLKNGNGVDEDIDLNLVKGLRSRIKKLENLLHQQQYKNLSNWPVVKSFGNKSSDNRTSMLLGSAATSPKPDTRPVSDPTKLLQRRHTTSSKLSDEPVGASRVLDASTTIDKHLDNIRLRKENAELTSGNSHLVKENAVTREENRSLRVEMEKKDRNILGMRNDFGEKYAIAQETIESLGIRHEEELQALEKEKQNEIDGLKQKNDSLNQRIKNLEKQLESRTEESNQVKDLELKLGSVNTELDDLKMIKSELLSNMHAKDADFANERNGLESEIRNLTLKVEEKTDDYESLMEIMQNKQHNMDSIISKLNKVVEGFLGNVDELVDSNYEYFKEFCYVLESMGLLLVKETDPNQSRPEFRIRRVKGLRSKKDDTGEADEYSIITESKLHSTVVDEITDSMNWREEVKENVDTAKEAGANNGSALNSHEAEASRLIEIYEKYFTNGENGTSKFTQLLRLISFKEDIQLQLQESESAIVNQRFFLNGISKRFKDVEGFAKKLTKENKLKSQEIARLVKSSNAKVSVNNFQVGDLVLFLPTRFEGTNMDENTTTPWTAFNSDAPHYFLDSENDDVRSKEWIVSRIAKITEHQVTKDNVHDTKENPFLLSLGVTWYMIQST